jgi:hypothetical protein
MGQQLAESDASRHAGGDPQAEVTFEHAQALFWPAWTEASGVIHEGSQRIKI